MKYLKIFSEKFEKISSDSTEWFRYVYLCCFFIMHNFYIFTVYVIMKYEVIIQENLLERKLRILIIIQFE